MRRREYEVRSVLSYKGAGFFRGQREKRRKEKGTKKGGSFLSLKKLHYQVTSQKKGERESRLHFFLKHSPPHGRERGGEKKESGLSYFLCKTVIASGEGRKGGRGKGAPTSVAGIYRPGQDKWRRRKRGEKERKRRCFSSGKAQRSVAKRKKKRKEEKGASDYERVFPSVGSRKKEIVNPSPPSFQLLHCLRRQKRRKNSSACSSFPLGMKTCTPGTSMWKNAHRLREEKREKRKKRRSRRRCSSTSLGKTGERERKKKKEGNTAGACRTADAVGGQEGGKGDTAGGRDLFGKGTSVGRKEKGGQERKASCLRSFFQRRSHAAGTADQPRKRKERERK